MIRVENLIKTYGQVRTLDGLNLHVEPGKVYGFLGPNGAGKTTTLRILSGLARPDAGQAWIMDQPVIFGQDRHAPNGADPRKMIGVLPEEPAFYAWMTPRELLRDLVTPLYGLSVGEAARQSAELLDRVGLSAAADRRIGGFSRGMRQRLGLAQALVQRPKILLLDEPVSAMDPSGRKEVLELIEALRQEATILLSTHILADVERVCDVIGIINHGRLVIESEREALLERFGVRLIEVEANGDLETWMAQARGLPGVESVSLADHTVRLQVKDAEVVLVELMKLILSQGLAVQRIEVVRPSLEDVFLRLTEAEPWQP
jgi:ABC-2 type transport system ATP-binding protein